MKAISCLTKLPAGPHELMAAQSNAIIIIMINWLHGKKKKTGMDVKATY